MQKLVVSLFPITKNIILLDYLFMAYNLLKGKRGIIFGALNDASIAWKVAERASEEGAQIVLTNTPVACRMGTIDELAKKTNATIIPADATSVDDLEKLFVQAQEVMGGKIDFVLHSVAMSVNMRKKRTYDDLDYGFLNKTLDISAISFHKMIQTAKKLDAINENGSILALSYVAAQRTSSAITIWRMQSLCWNPSPVVSVTFTGARKASVSIRFPSLRPLRPLAAASRGSMVCMISAIVCLLWVMPVRTNARTIVW